MNEVIKADSLYGLDFLGSQGIKAKLIYADPSYGVGGGNYRYDCYKDKTFGERFYKLIEKCRELLTEGGSIWK
ncbi:hypothetical protein ATZ36_01870 [Candidatus Endomicrobiellum trichonymphae]|uniref:DNA methylase N-4/N-6 domain-containing protein n=1 Tax=Endomicrobium trichonymphae TaxID=1408204 RepID=A0A1E5IH48_ENDTX|nr:hypothetical protein ATZ36_01870 [Candidatus Endomicrobium trichonymphae]